MSLTEITAYFLCLDIRNGLVQESRMVVVFVCILASHVKIDAHPHINASLTQSTRQTSSTTEEIDGIYSVIFGITCCLF